MMDRIRTHTRAGTESRAVYSACERYRYALARTWDTTAPQWLFVMLNPSTATELRNDPTVERCERRARAGAAGGFAIANIFAFRATDPRAMRAEADPIGPANDAALIGAAHRADRIVCAWGGHGAHLGRGRIVTAMLRDTGRPLLHLGLTAAGEPKHPLYIGYAVAPQPWLVDDAAKANGARGPGRPEGGATHGADESHEADGPRRAGGPRRADGPRDADLPDRVDGPVSSSSSRTRPRVIGP